MCVIVSVSVDVRWGKDKTRVVFFCFWSAHWFGNEESDAKAFCRTGGRVAELTGSDRAARRVFVLNMFDITSLHFDLTKRSHYLGVHDHCFVWPHDNPLRNGARHSCGLKMVLPQPLQEMTQVGRCFHKIMHTPTSRFPETLSSSSQPWIIRHRERGGQGRLTTT